MEDVRPPIILADLTRLRTSPLIARHFAYEGDIRKRFCTPTSKRKTYPSESLAFAALVLSSCNRVRSFTVADNRSFTLVELRARVFAPGEAPRRGCFHKWQRWGRSRMCKHQLLLTGVLSERST